MTLMHQAAKLSREAQQLRKSGKLNGCLIPERLAAELERQAIRLVNAHDLGVTHYAS